MQQVILWGLSCIENSRNVGSFIIMFAEFGLNSPSDSRLITKVLQLAVV